MKRSIKFNACVSKVLPPQQFLVHQKSVKDIWNKSLHTFENAKDEATIRLCEKPKYSSFEPFMLKRVGGERTLAYQFVPSPVTVKVKDEENIKKKVCHTKKCKKCVDLQALLDEQRDVIKKLRLQIVSKDGKLSTMNQATKAINKELAVIQDDFKELFSTAHRSIILKSGPQSFQALKDCSQ